MKKILIPTDFSENAYAALFYVSKLFSDEALQITILHSFGEEVSKLTSRVDIGRSESIVEKLYRQSDEDGKHVIHQIKLDSPQIAHNYEVISTPAPLSKTINTLVVWVFIAVIEGGVCFKNPKILHLIENKN